QDLLHGRAYAGQLAEIVSSGAHHGILGRQPDAIGDLAPHVLAVDHPAGRGLPGMPAPVTDGEAGGAIGHASASVRVSSWSYQSSSFSSSCSASSGIFFATEIMVWYSFLLHASLKPARSTSKRNSLRRRPVKPR